MKKIIVLLMVVLALLVVFGCRKPTTEEKVEAEKVEVAEAVVEEINKQGELAKAEIERVVVMEQAKANVEKIKAEDAKMAAEEARKKLAAAVKKAEKAFNEAEKAKQGAVEAAVKEVKAVRKAEAMDTKKPAPVPKKGPVKTKAPKQETKAPANNTFSKYIGGGAVVIFLGCGLYGLVVARRKDLAVESGTKAKPKRKKTVKS